MLTTAVIEALVAAGELKPWTAPGVLVPRRGFYVTDRVERALKNPWRPLGGESAETIARQYRDMIDLLSVWQRGDAIVARDQLKPMSDPPPRAERVWSLRATLAPPGARTLGILAARNIFVATGVGPRDRLGSKGSPAWNAYVGEALRRYDAWFPGDDALKWSPGYRFEQRHMKDFCDDVR